MLKLSLILSVVVAIKYPYGYTTGIQTVVQPAGVQQYQEITVEELFEALSEEW